MRYLLILLIGSCLLQSCQNFFSQKLDADPPPYDKAMVFHELVSRDDKGIRLNLSQNFGIFEAYSNDSVFFVRGANVEWWENGQKILDLLPVSADSSFVYAGQFPAPLQEGNNYEIRVSHPNFETVVARQQMPKQIAPLTNVELDRNIIKDEFGNPVDELRFTLKDDPAEENYYEISLTYVYYNFEYVGDDPSGNPIYDTLSAVDYPVFFSTIFDPNFVDGVGNTHLVSDQFFNGTDYKFIGRFQPNSFGTGIADSTPYTINIRSISKEYYRWSDSANRQSDSQNNPFAEPVSVYSNLEKGLGIFAMFSQSSTTVK
jgi:hypothetical protein